MAAPHETLRTKFETEPTDLGTVRRVYTKIFPDERGSVMEFVRQSDIVEAGLPPMDQRPQTNLPFTVRGGLRGIHAEYANKLVTAAFGSVYAVIVDLDVASAQFGEWRGFTLNRGEGLFVPAGYGNSFVALTDSIYAYDFSAEWAPGMPGVACTPFDPELSIDWQLPTSELIVSEKDLLNPTLKEIRNLGRVSLK